jgi:hypothetical protein
VVLLDESGSMASSLDGRAWEVAREIALHIAQSNLENTSLALMIFSDKVHEQIGFAQGNTAVLARLKEIGADPSYIRKNLRGQTATYDAIRSAVRLLDSADSSDSIYLISDGDENKSQSKFVDVTHALGTRNVRLHLTLLASGAPKGLRNQTSEQLESVAAITNLSIDSGGWVVGPFGIRTPNGSGYSLTSEQVKDLGAVLSRFYTIVTNNELMEIELPQTDQKWERLSLEFSLEKKKLYKNFKITYPKELASCGALPH